MDSPERKQIGCNCESKHQLILINYFSLLLLSQLNRCQFIWSFIYTIFIPKNDIVPKKYLEVPNTALTPSQWRWPRLPDTRRVQTEQTQVPPLYFFFFFFKKNLVPPPWKCFSSLPVPPYFLTPFVFLTYNSAKMLIYTVCLSISDLWIYPSSFAESQLTKPTRTSFPVTRSSPIPSTLSPTRISISFGSVTAAST